MPTTQLISFWASVRDTAKKQGLKQHFRSFINLRKCLCINKSHFKASGLGTIFETFSWVAKEMGLFTSCIPYLPVFYFILTAIMWEWLDWVYVPSPRSPSKLLWQSMDLNQGFPDPTPTSGIRMHNKDMMAEFLLLCNCRPIYVAASVQVI